METLRSFIHEAIWLLTPFPSLHAGKFLMAFLFFTLGFGWIGLGPTLTWAPRKLRAHWWFFAPVMGASLFFSVSGLAVIVTGKFGATQGWVSFFSLALISTFLVFRAGAGGIPHPSKRDGLAILGWLLLVGLYANSMRQAIVPTQFDAGTHTHFHLLMEMSGTYPEVRPFPGSDSTLRIFYGPTAHEFVSLLRSFGWSMGDCWIVAGLLGFAFCALAIFSLLAPFLVTSFDIVFGWLAVATPALFWNGWEGGIPEYFSLILITASLGLLVYSRTFFSLVLGAFFFGAAFHAYPHMVLSYYPAFGLLFLLSLFVKHTRATRRPWEWIFFCLGSASLVVLWYVLVYHGHTQGEMLRESWSARVPVVIPWVVFPYYFGLAASTAALLFLGLIAAPKLSKNPRIGAETRRWIGPMFIGMLIMMEHWILLPLLPRNQFQLYQETYDPFLMTPWFFRSFTRAPDPLVIVQNSFLLLMPFAIWGAWQVLQKVLPRKLALVAALFSLLLWGECFLVLHYKNVKTSPAEVALLTRFRHARDANPEQRESELILTKSWATNADLWVSTLTETRTVHWRQEAGHARIIEKGISREALLAGYENPMTNEFRNALLKSPVTHVYLGGSTLESARQGFAKLPFLKLVDEEKQGDTWAQMYAVVR